MKRHIRYVKLQYYYTSANIIKKSVRERERKNREKQKNTFTFWAATRTKSEMEKKVKKATIKRTR